MKNKQESSNNARNAQNTQNASEKQNETQNKTKGGCGCKKSSSTKNCG